MLSRNLNDNTANFAGVALDTVTDLGSTYVDLHGYGPVVQGILGAAAYCEFSGTTGGQWQDGLWPPINTTNTVFGTLVNDRPTAATMLLNYGPSWQYNPDSENTLPGGSVSYIANNTGPDVSFPALFASYIRNQWTLMAYSIPRQSGAVLSLPFFGSGPQQLYISVTTVVVFPIFALAIGLLATSVALMGTIYRYKWVNRVEFESWWVLKALSPRLYAVGYSNGTEKDFESACKGFGVAYRDIRPDDDIGQLMLCPTNTDVVTTAPQLDAGRIYR